MSDPSDKRFVVLATLHVNPAKADEFEKVFRPFVKQVRQEPGCIKFDVIVTPARDEFFMYEIYKDEAAFQDHCAAEHHEYFHSVARNTDNPLFTKNPTVRLDYKVLSDV